MTREKLNSYLGKRVTIQFKDGATVSGILGFTPEFSQKYGYRKPNYYTCSNWDFKLSHVRTIKAESEKSNQ